MSRVSEISRQYHSALSLSQQQYEDLYHQRVGSTETFYKTFFHKLVLNLGDQFKDERFRERMQEIIERATGSTTLQFIAVDGTCKKEVFSDLITFFGGAYGARGEVELGNGKHAIRYKRWSLDYDVSMVAWIPVPFARLEEVTPSKGSEFLLTEEERINLSAVHVQVMQLAEIFLAYNSVTSSRLDAPHILLMDLSPSSVLASVATAQKNIGLVGYPYDRRALTKADITIALAHPFSDFLGIPSPKKMDLYRVLVAELGRNPKEPLDLKEIAAKSGVPEDDLKRASDFLVSREILSRPRIGQPNYAPKINVEESWSYVRDFFQNICSRLFIKKDPTALQYDAPDTKGTLRRRWMAPDDLGFLIGVGMRLLIEACWERKVLFYGVVKDSSSCYLTRNFLGVSLETEFHPDLRKIEAGVLPWTDRIFCEILPLIDDGLCAPWTSIEFDSAFMTLHRELDPESEVTRVAGVMGRIVNQERLFAKSLAQFFLKREKSTPLMGHVVFLERLLGPPWDQPGPDRGPCEIMIDTPEIGRLGVFAWRDRNHVNLGQRVMMYLLSVLTRNHFAEVVGYPDPLHKADWGAKTLGRSVGDIIKSSTHLLASKPISRTFRDIRDRAKR